MKARNAARAEKRSPRRIFFVDLNLDQIVAAITAGKEEYDLAPFFYAPLRDIDAVLYRHEVMRDLEDAGLLAQINSFAQALRSMRETLKQAEKRHYRRQKEALFLDAVDAYCGAVDALTRDLGACGLALPRSPVLPRLSGRLREFRLVSPRSWRRPRS